MSIKNFGEFMFCAKNTFDWFQSHQYEGVSLLQNPNNGKREEKVSGSNPTPAIVSLARIRQT